MIVIDFFCGCGGASEGLRQAGFDIELGLDIDQQASETFKANFPDAKFIQDDIRKIEPQDISDIIDIKAKRPLLLSACAPCQPFSQQNKNKTSDDSRRNLLNETHRFIRELLPEYIMLENVPGMQKIDEEKEGPFQEFIKLLKELEYNYISFIANAENYGIPQRRKRLVLLASRVGKVTLPEITHGKNKIPFKTVRDYIQDFTKLCSGETDPKDPLHRAGTLSPLNLKRIMHTPEGGDRRNYQKS